MYNDFVVSNNLLGNATLHNRSEGVANYSYSSTNFVMNTMYYAMCVQLSTETG